jgi:hypothetical protein
MVVSLAPQLQLVSSETVVGCRCRRCQFRFRFLFPTRRNVTIPLWAMFRSAEQADASSVVLPRGRRSISPSPRLWFAGFSRLYFRRPIDIPSEHSGGGNSMSKSQQRPLQGVVA